MQQESKPDEDKTLQRAYRMERQTLILLLVFLVILELRSALAIAHKSIHVLVAKKLFEYKAPRICS